MESSPQARVAPVEHPAERNASEEELRQALGREEGGRRWLRRTMLAAGIALALGAGVVVRARHKPAVPSRFLTASAATGDVIEKVTATGAVQPVLQVNIGAQANGRVTRVLVDFNSRVKAGDVLAEIDSTIYGTQVAQQEANLSAQRAQLASAKAGAENARIALDRTQKLYEQNLASRADLDTVRGQFNVARSAVDAQQAAIGAIDAQLRASRTNVGYTKIFSPVDGIVISRTIDPGATVVASFQAPVLFVIAQDLRKMRVLADVDEADVGRLKEKMDADAVVDAFPGDVFHGVVEQVRFSPNNVQGVITYPAVVEVDNSEEKLRPGMTATITIRTREAKGVLHVPNAALRYKPTPPSGPDGKPIPAPLDPPLAKGEGRVYVVTGAPPDEKAEPHVIKIGITDGVQTEVVSGLDADAKIVTDETAPPKKRGLF
jgi:HlyD family secretion protein